MSMFGQSKHHTVGYVAWIVIMILEIGATQIVITIDEKGTHIMCALCVVLSLLWYEVTRAEWAAHYVTLTVVTWYQLYFIEEHMHEHVAMWLEVAMTAAVYGVFAVDYYLTSLKSVETSCPHDFRGGYGYVAGLVLIGLSLIPLHGAGLFFISDISYLLLFLVTWPLLAYTESQRRLSRGLDVCLPHSALKSLSLLAMPHYQLPCFVVLAFIAWARPPSSTKHTHASALKTEKAAEEIALGGNSSVMQRAAANGVVYSHHQDDGGDHERHLEADAHGYRDDAVVEADVHSVDM